MPLNINVFKSAIHKYDLERPCLFEITFGIPKVITDHPDGNGKGSLGSVEQGQLLTLYCKSANLPGMNIATADAQRYGIGPQIKMPVRGALNDISLTFLNDSKSNIYGYFYTWMNYIYPQTQNNKRIPGAGGFYTNEYKKNYQCDMTATVYHGKPGQYSDSLFQTIVSVASAAAGVPFVGSLLGQLNTKPAAPLRPVKKYTIADAFPTNISDISLSTSSTDTVSEFTVGFAYRTFEIELEIN